VASGEAKWLEEGGYNWGRGGCYHYYPNITQVKKWVEQVGFQVMEERADEEYHHFMVLK
jgi:hypothetical protein